MRQRRQIEPESSMVDLDINQGEKGLLLSHKLVADLEQLQIQE